MANKSFDLSGVRNRIIDHIELLPSEVRDHPGQAWDHPSEQARALHGILSELGIIDELLVYKSERAGGAYVTIDGHLRKSLDSSKSWPCTVLDLTDAEADYALATHDPVGMMKKTNVEALDALLSEVSSGDAAVQSLLADTARRAGLYLDRDVDASGVVELDVDRAAEYLVRWPVEVGQLWRLGGHTLYCGDSMLAESYSSVMQGAHAEMTFTSPPYNLGIDTGLKYQQKYTDALADAKTADQYLALLSTFTEHSLAHSDFVFVNLQLVSGNKLALVDYQYRLRAHLAEIMVWDKGHAQPAMKSNVLNSRFEFVYIFSASGTRMIGASEFRGTLDNVVSLETGGRNAYADVHRAVFPLELPLWFISRFTTESGHVLEPFAGTGTTLCACEKLGRTCHAIELAPAYCALILERFQSSFGIEPELVV